MNIRKKAGGMLFSATLLSALVATVAAPLALASVSVTSAGAVPKGGTSAGTAAFTFTENSAACFSTVAQPTALVVTILDNAAAATVTFSGTPVVTSPGSLGPATASISGNTLTVAFLGSDTINIEQVTVSGLSIKATTAAASGAIGATLTGTAGRLRAAPATATASGHLTLGPYPIGGPQVFTIALDIGSCPFADTTPVTFTPVSKLNFVTNPEAAITTADRRCGRGYPVHDGDDRQCPHRG